VKVGELQATSLLAKLQSDGKTGDVVWINGSPTDNNATLFAQGAHSVIPKGGIDGFKIGYEIATPDWTPSTAQQEAAAAITRLGKNNIVGIYSANDGMAAGIYAAEKAAGITDFPPMTGQDSQVDGIQRILAGEQYMDIYKAIKPEATDAAQLAVDLLQGTTPGSMGDISLTQTTDGTTQVPSYLLTPVAVTKSNIASTVVADGFLTVAQICTADYAADCKADGLS
jgi:D-xylose transport system substrate-binding protein